MSTNRQLSDFEGTWRVDRSIHQADGTTGRFVGQAVFSPGDAGGLDYEEEGELTLGAMAPMRATRRYHWAEGLEVFFDDGRVFHTVPADVGSALHICPPDEYRVAYAFDHWPLWTATWDVSGPRKSYRMVSTYHPT